MKPLQKLWKWQKIAHNIFLYHIKKSIVDGYKDACVNPDNCYSCDN